MPGGGVSDPSYNWKTLTNRLLDMIGLPGLDGLGGGAVLKRGFAAQFHAAIVVAAAAFYPDHFALFDHVSPVFQQAIRQPGNMELSACS